jgi:Ulp1 family protease
MTTMKEEGVEAISTWIKNKHINVFEKKLLFIPIHADSHWSLCVVVNPALIQNSSDFNSDPSEEITL